VTLAGRGSSNRPATPFSSFLNRSRRRLRHRLILPPTPRLAAQKPKRGPSLLVYHWSPLSRSIGHPRSNSASRHFARP
jgi:hypothetical protein